MTLDHVLQDEEQITVNAVERITDALAVQQDIHRDCVVRSPFLDTADIMEPCCGVKNKPLGSR